MLLLSLRFTTLSSKTHLLPRRSQEALLCAKAKQQQQSAQSEKKSTPRFAKDPTLFNMTLILYIYFFNNKKITKHLFMLSDFLGVLLL